MWSGSTTNTPILKSDQLQWIQRQTRHDGLNMRCSESRARQRIDDLRRRQLEPQQYCGFVMDIMRRDHYENPGVPDFIDFRRVVSLACLRELYKSIIGPTDSADREVAFIDLYQSKLPIMCVNYQRLVFTIRAFEFLHKINRNARIDAIDFLLNHDLKLNAGGVSGGKDLHKKATVVPANKQFSILLHRLRSSGYREYFFELALHLEYDLEFMRTTVTDRVYVYKNFQKKSRGVLTVFHDDASRWFATISKNSLLRNETTPIDMQYPRLF